jgi:hypothetical protein
MIDQVEEWLAGLSRAEALVLATEPVEITKLEIQFGMDQPTAVAHIIESTDWGVEAFPEFQDGKGAFADRLLALRSKWDEWQRA